MKILAFAASSSRKSINKALAADAAARVAAKCEAASVEVLDLNDFEVPLFSVDSEADGGIPDHAQRFYERIGDADALVVSYAEHNGSYTAAFKNLFDWASRVDVKVFQDKPMLILATSPGERGAAGVLATALQSAPHFGADVMGSLSVPSFYDAFDVERGLLKDATLSGKLDEIVKKLAARLPGR